MSPKLTRLLLVGAMAAGFGVAPMLDAYAGGPGIDVTNNKFGDGGIVQAPVNEPVTWHINEGTHTVSPDPEADGAKWPVKASDQLEAPKDFQVTFKSPGKYHYMCENHPEMKGTILVSDPNATTTTTAAPTTTTTAAPTTTTTARPAPAVTTTTTAAPASSQGAKPLTPAPAPTTTTAKDKKGKDDKKDETTTTTVPPPPPPVDLPDSAIIPVLPGAATGTTTQNGIEAPSDTPEGDAIALLKKKGGNGQAVKLLILSGFGLGALGIGTAGYKYANRSSKYFPA